MNGGLLFAWIRILRFSKKSSGIVAAFCGSKDQKLADLDAQYASDKAELTREYGDAVMHDDTETANALKEEIVALDEWYDEEYRKIEEEE